MSNNADVFEESIADISFIEKAEHSCNDLEDSINQCVLLFAKSMEQLKNKKKPIPSFTINETPKKITHQKIPVKSSMKKNTLKPIKSILKSSKEKINEMKNRITNIFEEENDIISNIVEINEKNQSEVNRTYLTSQRNFEDNLDQLYEEKISMLNQINKEYNEEIYKIDKYCYEERIDNINIKEPTINDIILEEIKRDKEKAIKQCESLFDFKKRNLFREYKAIREQYEDYTIDDRSVLYQSELFDNIKEKLNEVVSPEKKTVRIRLSGNKILNDFKKISIKG